APAVTVTPGRTPPVESVTVPVMSPVVRCARAAEDRPSTSSTRARPDFQRVVDMIGVLSGSCEESVTKVSAFVSLYRPDVNGVSGTIGHVVRSKALGAFS